MTHDLFSQTLAECGVAVSRIIVSDLSEDTFRARLMLQIDGREVDLDARPSDAIALAVRAGVPIFATDSVLDRAGVVPEGADEERLSVFREFVNSLNVDLPDDSGEGRSLDGARSAATSSAAASRRLARPSVARPRDC